jgi:hypothetical protein
MYVCNETNSMHYVSSVYSVTIPLHVSGLLAARLTTPHMLINTWQELEYRLDICRATTGAHIEVYGCA